MEKGIIFVYNGRGMVIGCVEVGKIIFVKKLKGENNFLIMLIIGIDIYVYEFKLDVEECIIISK